MPELNLKSYRQVIDTMNKIIYGLKKRKDDEGFPSIVNEEVLSGMIQKLVETRELYEEQHFAARRTHEEYKQQMQLINAELSKCKTLLYGFYGKKNRVILEFGLKPYKSKPKGASNPSSDANSTESATQATNEEVAKVDAA